MLQPVRAWNIGREAHFSGTMAAATAWIAMNLKFPTVPNATHSSSAFMLPSVAIDIISINCTK